MDVGASLVVDRFKRPNIEAPLVVWEYAMTLERWVLNAEERLAELLADTLVLMDQTASAEVQMEARRRIIERHGEPTNA